ncbi:carboxylase [Actinomycetospora sp. NBRC 106375]|uniref:carboxyltransferase n=1 Tax=Actinomycetospora sp. NBRC 106375 TaxID=3032207 RepID=UPI0024A0CF60|nr:carboxyltransferase [Actinomycetospora sp. NBRC 106375]GLZ50240.1 carboxylase [Actinomycetospora sp. NBRC 106375]
MTHVEVLDTTLRDGQQAVWGMRMQAGMALPVAPVIDRTGYSVIDLTASSLFEVLVRTMHENPWDGLDMLIEAMPHTPKRAGMRSNASVTFGITPDALMDAWMRQLNVHGIRSTWVYDVLFNIDKMLRLASVAKEFGSTCAGALMFTLSPVHTDEYYADKVKRLATSDDIDSILIYDTAGVLEKERLSTLVPALIEQANGKPIELHANNILGQSGKAYLDAVDLGVTVLHTSNRPLANGPAVPSTQMTCHNLALLGHTHDVDTSKLDVVARHFEQVGATMGWPVNLNNEYDALAVQHQIPGGMVGTLRQNLAQHDMVDRLDDVLWETARVRKELGYPGMATPFSQIVGIQAVLNIVSGERYKVVTDEVIWYAAGHYGEMVAPIDDDVLDKIMSSPRAQSAAGNPPEQPTIEELRKRHGTQDDDELLLRALVPEADLDRMRAAGPTKRHFEVLASPELRQVNELLKATDLPAVQIKLGELQVELYRQGF